MDYSEDRPIKIDEKRIAAFADRLLLGGASEKDIARMKKQISSAAKNGEDLIALLGLLANAEAIIKSTQEMLDWTISESEKDDTLPTDWREYTAILRAAEQLEAKVS